MVQDGTRPAFLRGTTDLAAGGGDVVDGHIPGIHTMLGQCGQHPPIEVFIGVLIAQTRHE